MEQSHVVTQHPGTIDAYIRHGWSLVPIPPGTKGPATRGWNLKENALKSYSELPPGWGIGLAHAYSGTMALDIDDMLLASMVMKEAGIDLDALYNAPGMVHIYSGRHGHGKLLFRMPAGLVLASKKISTFNVLVNRKTTALELRCASIEGTTVQDVLPPSIHPETNQAYQWGGADWRQTPEIPQQLLMWWMSLIEADNKRVIKTPGPIDASWTEIQAALDYCDPDCSRDEWRNIGMALHYVGEHVGEPDRAFQMWDEWSAKSPTKYPTPRDMVIQWRSFKSDKPTVVKLGTLFKHAHDRGWTRPLPDVSHLFGPVISEPELITNTINPAPPNLDLSLLPPILRERALEVADAIGCDPLVPVASGIGAMCAVADARIRLELMPGFKVPPVMWIMTIGKPADKKSPGSHPMLEVLKKLEFEDQANFEQQKLRFEALEARYKIEHENYMKQVVDVEHLLNNQVPMPTFAPPTKPVNLRLRTKDPTSQKMVRMCADRPAGLLLHLDEMKSWLGKVCDARSGEDRSCWVSGYEANDYSMDRVGAGSIYCENFAISIFGNVQPDVMREHMKSMVDDGMLQRFLPVTLRTNMTRLGDPMPDYMTKARDWEIAARAVHSIPPQVYRLSDGAYRLFREFQAWYEKQKQRNVLLNSNNSFQTAFGKLEGTTGRLMLMFHLMETPFISEVSADLAERVIKIAKSFIVPSLRYAFSELGQKSDFDMWLMEHLIQFSDKQQISLGEIRRSAARQLAKVSTYQQDSMILAGMAIYEEAGWVVRIDDGSMEHRRIAQWAINPRLVDAFAARRRAVTKAKQEMVDMIRENSPGTTPDSPRTIVRGYEGD